LAVKFSTSGGKKDMLVGHWVYRQVKRMLGVGV